ncbi:MAG: hypothetical protein PHX21_03985 [bacterium]|nr:hypothetical protein [bacterium]
MKIYKTIAFLLLSNTLNAQYSGDNSSRYSIAGHNKYMDKDKLVTSLKAQLPLMTCRLATSYELPSLTKYVILSTVNGCDIEFGTLDIGYTKEGMVTLCQYQYEVPVNCDAKEITNFLSIANIIRDIVAINMGVEDSLMERLKRDKDAEIEYFIKRGITEFEASGRELKSNNTYGLYIIDNIVNLGYENKYKTVKLSFYAMPK